LGVMGGYPCGTVPTEPCGTTNKPYFRPNNNVTRGQASKIVANTFFPNCVTPGAADGSSSDHARRPTR
ncbi:MAG: S-layer homology domain-containing protein, partial [Chloroflexota bacterium]|nr:S-layer homology domain-containing protein [Chloroflexota bacterium]